jgi:hypothetical protein
MRSVREDERPAPERGSVLDREPKAGDVSVAASRRFRGVEVETARRALTSRGHSVLVARSGGDGLYVAIQGPGPGGGMVGSTRGVLGERGAIVLVSSEGRRVFVGGIVADDVSAVRVGDVPAQLRNNGFLAEIGPDDSPVVVITKPAGDREEPR